MLEDQKIPIQEAYFDVESETLPTAPGSAWMMLEKRGARYHLHICKLGLQQLPRSHLRLEHQLSGWACFHLSTQP